LGIFIMRIGNKMYTQEDQKKCVLTVRISHYGTNLREPSRPVLAQRDREVANSSSNCSE